MTKKFCVLTIVMLLVAGCAPKTLANSEQSQPQTDPKSGQDRAASTIPQAEAVSRPFVFKVDLDQLHAQKSCDEETGKCRSFSELGLSSEIKIYVRDDAGSVNYDIDCDGDNTFEQTGLTKSTSCKYAQKSGQFRIQMRGEIPGMVLCGDDETEQDYGFSNHLAVISIEQWGDIHWKTMNSFAQNCQNLTIPAKDAPILDEVTDMSAMFMGALHFNQPIGHWDISHATNLARMFTAAFEFNQPLDKWDTSHVTDMSNMFMLCRAFNQPIGNWDVSHVTDMSGLFSEASEFNQPLEKWDVSHVTSMDGMFRGASSFNQPLNTWDVSHVTNMQGMFNRAAAFSQPLDKWDVSAVKYMNAMFWGAKSFGENIDGWNVSAVQNMGGMFQDSGREALPVWFHAESGQ